MTGNSPRCEAAQSGAAPPRWSRLFPLGPLSLPVRVCSNSHGATLWRRGKVACDARKPQDTGWAHPTVPRCQPLCPSPASRVTSERQTALRPQGQARRVAGVHVGNEECAFIQVPGGQAWGAARGSTQALQEPLPLPAPPALASGLISLLSHHPSRSPAEEVRGLNPRAVLARQGAGTSSSACPAVCGHRSALAPVTSDR